MNFKKLTIPKKATMYIILGSIVLSLIAMFFANNMIKNKAKREVIQVIKNLKVDKAGMFRGTKIEFDDVECTFNKCRIINARLSNDNNDYGLGDYFSNQINTFYNEGKYVKVLTKKEIKDPLYISYTTNSENNVLIDYNLIEVEEFGKATIIITYNSEDEAKAYHNGVIKVMARANSEVKIIKVQTLNLESENYESSKIEVLGGGKVSMYTVELGAKVNGVSHKTYLEEDNASASIWPAYLADKDRKVDLEYSVVFRGRRGNGEIQGRGAVKGTSKKVFRGNLYFKRGSSKSEGNEGEFAILLDKTVKADSIPTLFCDEDDVIGAHSASIGKVDESKLFYLMSRGLTESRAKKLIVESSFRPILESINDDEIRNKILNELENRI